FQAEDGIRDRNVTGVQTCALPIYRRGLRVAIASSSDQKAIRRFMEAAGVTGLVDYVISGEECTAHKPDPEIYLRAMAALGLTPEDRKSVVEGKRRAHGGARTGNTK